MSSTALIPFAKMEGCGNDFVILSELHSGPITELTGSNWGSISSRLLDRHFGIGADQLMLIQPAAPTSPVLSDFRVKVFNSDGSEAGMCGNGIRCVTRFLIDSGEFGRDKKEISFEVGGNLIRCFPKQNGELVRVDMGIPTFDPLRIPLAHCDEMIDMPVSVEGDLLKISAVSISGTPHCVLFVESLVNLNLAEIGPKLERHKLFPNRANVEFVEKKSDRELSVRVWERGAGETLACGSGACAVLAVSARTQRVDRSAKINLPGGQLEIDWDRRDDHIYLSGPARHVYSGELARSFFE